MQEMENENTPSGKKISNCERKMHIINEVLLIVGGIPAIILFFLAGASNLILLIDQDNYDTGVLTKKAAKTLSGGNPDDISDMLKWHLFGSIICGCVFIVLYGQILFNAIPIFYKYTGSLLLVSLFLIFGHNAVSTYWLIEDEGDDTRYYYTAIANNALQFILIILVFVISMIIFGGVGCKTSNDSVKVGTAIQKDAKPTELPASQEEKKRKEDWDTGRKDGKYIPSS